MQDFNKKNKKELVQRAALFEPKFLSVEENLNLPLPRLEIRVIERPEIPPEQKKLEYGKFANIYGIVRLNFDQQIELTPLEWSLPSFPGKKETVADIDLSWRLEAHLLNDMIELNLPGFWVKGAAAVEITLNNRELPKGIVDKLEKRQDQTKLN